jgi:hypothetical protein
MKTTLRNCKFLATSLGLGDFVVDDSTPKLEYDFETNSILGWSGSLATLTPSISGVTFVPTGNDPMLRSPAALTINGATQRYIYIDVERTALRTIGYWQGQIYYVTSGHQESHLFSYAFPEIANVIGERVTIVADMHNLLIGGTDWEDSTITQIRIDFEDGQTVVGVTPNGQFKIHSILVGDAIAAADLPVDAGALDGVTYNYMASYDEEDEWESGDGLWTESTSTLARGVIVSSSNNNKKVNFSGTPIVTVATVVDIPAAITTGRFLKSTFFTASDTWTKDPETKKILAFVTGGGAGSGGSTGVLGASGGAGAGATAISLLDVSAVTSWAIVVGAAGTAGVTGPGAHGGPGGTSSINATTVSANGGLGSNSPANDAADNGGAGATIGIGDIVIPGGAGAPGDNSSAVMGGIGGASFWGGGGRARFGTGNDPGQAYGSGAGGQAGTSGAGKAGKPGLVWILEFS